MSHTLKCPQRKTYLSPLYRVLFRRTSRKLTLSPPTSSQNIDRNVPSTLIAGELPSSLESLLSSMRRNQMATWGFGMTVV